MTLHCGGWEIELLTCGLLDLPGEAIGPIFDEPVMTPVMATLWRGCDRVALVDAGSGPCDVLWPGAGGLLEALAGAGVSAEEITDVVLTHLDFDHCGGVVAGTWPEPLSPAFPSVPVRVAEFGLDAWRSAEDDPTAVGPRILRSLRDAGVLVAFADGSDVLPGVRARSAPGHSPGHTVLEVADETGVVLHLADAIHHRIHVENPSWDCRYDDDAGEALATRTRLIAEAAERNATVIASHVDAPGRIDIRDGHGAWVDLG